MLTTKLISSLEKVMLTDTAEKFSPLEKISVLKGERLSFQVLYVPTDNHPYEHILWEIKAESELAKYTSARNVANIGVTKPCYKQKCDDKYLSYEPGFYPDILLPLRNGGAVATSYGAFIKSIWFEVEVPENFPAGEYPLTVTLESKLGKYLHTLKIDVIDAVLPELDGFKYTNWFHCDSLASYYGVEIWSERHWEIIENFAKSAVRSGVNLLLTPLFTLALDTRVGGERPTHQLVGVTKVGDRYEFDFSLVERWIDMCDRIGVKYFEICHLFTQWGAYHAPKIMATVNGEYKKIFGWGTDSVSPEYTAFLRSFLTEFLSFMKKRGLDKRCLFHISDEPSLDHLESYKAAKNSIAGLLEGYTIMDAMSKYELYEQGVVSTAIPSNDHIEPFLENKVPDLWTYYCCSQAKDVSNRFIAQSSPRCRSIGMQMYKYDIVGFLHWGFNFYQNRHSMDAVNPYLNTCGDEWVPAGDMFIVYPAQDGTAYDSLRLPVFFDALQDMRAMKLCEKYCPKDQIIAGVEKILGEKIKFDKCVEDSDTMLKMREYVNGIIKKAVSG